MPPCPVWSDLLIAPCFFSGSGKFLTFPSISSRREETIGLAGGGGKKPIGEIPRFVRGSGCVDTVSESPAPHAWMSSRSSMISEQAHPGRESRRHNHPQLHVAFTHEPLNNIQLPAGRGAGVLPHNGCSPLCGCVPAQCHKSKHEAYTGLSLAQQSQALFRRLAS